jgi:asparagine synthase (glutamine-hydrolysing)
MCGVTGMVDLAAEPVSAVVLRAMTDAIAHRGPDGEGQFCDGPVGLGHRRLAIIDPTPAGHQPMLTADGRYVLSYNGEVYNFDVLRAELEAHGRQFHSRTDSEVVLHALAHWGTDALTRFNGMFALALYDRERRELLLARDRYGIKPMYYALRGDVLLFGSEIKAMLAHPALTAQIDHEALAEYLCFQNYFSSRTLFRNVSMLPAGSWMRVRVGDRSMPHPVRYWDFAFAEDGSRTDRAEVVEELDRRFRQAVSRHLIADVPVGSYLSGGMDSGSITALASREIDQLCTFTVGFDLHSASGLEIGFDERSRAETMSYLCKTTHYEMVLKAGDMERVMPRLTWHLEEPRVGQSYPNFFAAHLASKFGKVVLSGTGGDELFGGYPWRYYRGAVNRDFDHYIDKYFSFWQRLLPEEAYADALRPSWPAIGPLQPRNVFRSVFPPHLATPKSSEDYINHSLYFEAKTFLHGLLTVDDKLSMAHGLETRVPFLDNDLVDFAMSVPVRHKLGNLDAVVALNENDPGNKIERFYQHTRDGKLVLRDAMRRYIPDEATQLEKQGFSAPDASWFRGESIDYVRQRLHGGAKIFEYLDRDTIGALVDDHLEGRHNRRLLIWSLLSLEQWCETFLDGQIPEPFSRPRTVGAATTAVSRSPA